MRRSTILVLIASVALLGVVWWALHDEQAPDAPVAVPVAASPSVASSAAAATPVQAEPPPPSERTSLPAQPKALPLATVRGCCVDAASGAPVAGCTVALRGRSRDRSRRAIEDGQRWEKPRPIETDTGGRFELALAPPPGFSFTLTLTPRDHVELQSELERIAPGQALDLGEIRLLAGTRVRGLVVDEQRAPVERLRIELRGEEHAPAKPELPHAIAWACGPSDAQGRFSIAPLLPGTYTLRVDGEHTLLSPRAIDVPLGLEEVTVEVLVKAPDPAATISGVVVDEQGAPVPHVQVSASAEPLRGLGDSAYADARGAFVIQRRHASGDQVLLALDDTHQQGYTLAGEPVPGRWGERDLRLVVRPPVRVLLTVVDADSGAPVEAFSVRCLPFALRYFSSSMADMKTTGHHPRGEATLEGIARGQHQVLVYPDDDAWVASEPFLFTAVDRDTPVRIELPRRSARIAVRIVDRAGAPRAGITVQLLRKQGPEAQPLAISTLCARPEEMYVKVSTNGAYGLILDEVRTDAEGRATLRAPPRPQGYAVKLPGPGHIPLLRTDVVPSASELELMVASGATVHGRLGPTEAVQTLRAAIDARFRGDITVQLVGRDGQGAFPAGPSSGLALAEDATFHAEGVPPGSYTVRAAYALRIGEQTTFSAVELGMLERLGDGEIRDAELDLRPHLPGRLHATVLLDGEPYAHGVVFVGQGKASTDATGRFTVPLPPGKVRVSVQPKGVDSDAPFARAIPAAEEADVLPGGEVEQVFRAEHRRLRLCIREADGGPAAERWVQVSCLHGEVQPDAAGIVIVDPAPLEAIAVATWPKGVKAETAHARQATRIELARELRMPAGEKAATIELRVPAGQ